MASNLSIAQMLAELERQIADHRAQEKHHAEQEVFHRERRAHHAAELETALERVEAFRAAAAAAGELVERHRPEAPPAPAPPPSLALPNGKRRPASWAVAYVVAQQPPDATFTATDLARAAGSLFRDQLRRPLDGRAVSVTLRRLAATGRLHVLREGTPHHEALYSRTRPPA